MSAFVRYIGIDYSGAETPTSRLKGLRVYSGDCERLPEEVLPLTGPRRYWTRCGVAEWLCCACNMRRRRWSESSTAPFHCAILRRTSCHQTGLRSWMTFNGTGRRTKIIFTSISCAMVLTAMVPPAPAVRAGAA